MHAFGRAAPDTRKFRSRRTIPADVAAMLAATRRGLGLSVREAARGCGVASGTIGHLEHGRRALSIVVAEDIISAYRLAGRDAAQLRAVAVTDAGRSFAPEPRP